MTLSPADFAVFAVVIAALITDLKWMRVPNKLTFTFMGLGVALAIFQGSPLDALLGIVLAFVLMFPGWRFGGAVRAGDAKLLMRWGPSTGRGRC